MKKLISVAVYFLFGFAFNPVCSRFRPMVWGVFNSLLGFTGLKPGKLAEIMKKVSSELVAFGNFSSLFLRRFSASQSLEGGRLFVGKKQFLLILLIGFTISLLMLPAAEWGFTDDDIFVLNYLKHLAYSPPIWPGNGRFFPLGHQEWRLFPQLKTSSEFHAIAIFEYIVFCVFISAALELKIHSQGLSPLLFICTLPPVIVSFCTIVAPERNQLLLVSIWLYLYLKNQETRHFSTAILGLTFANVALYYKEPTFLFFSGFAVTQIFLSYLDKRDFSTVFRARWEDFLLIISGLAYLVSYLYFIKSFSIISSKEVYGGQSFSLINIVTGVLAWIEKEPLALAYVPLVILLTFVRLRPSYENERVGIGLWVGSILYIFALLGAHLTSKYYAALPILGIGLSFVFLTNATGIFSLVRPFLFVLSLSNILFWLPALIYQIDWMQRNVQLTDSLLNMPEAHTEKVMLRADDSWLQSMFLIYAKEYKKVKIDFICQSKNPSWLPLTYTCPEAQLNPAIVVNLDYRNNGSIFLRDKEYWHFNPKWKAFPDSFRKYLNPHYAFW